MAISVSNEYKAMMRGRQVSSRIHVVILSGDSSVTLTDDDIVKGSWNVNWRSSNNRSFSLGTCYATSLSFSSFVSVEPEIDGESIMVIPTMIYKVGNSEESIPLGQFTCDSPKVFSKTTSYECIDRMIAFDKRVEARFSGTPYNAIVYICQKCEVEFGLSQQQVANMINSSQTVVIDPAQVNTYRDALSYISILLGGYCMMDRYGYFVIRQFHISPDLDLPRHRRITTTFGGYKTCFCGVKCRFLAEQNFYPYSSIDEEAEGLILDLGDIPIIEDTENAKKRLLGNIHDLLSHIEYYPCEIEMVGDPSIEAGDMITTKDRYGIDRNILLTSVTYAWRASGQIVSEGGNPKLENVSTLQKRQAVAQDAAAKAAAIVTGTYVNADEIEVDETERTDISSLRFVTNKDLTAIFGAEIPVYSDGDGYVEITYVNSGIDGDSFKARVHEGYNLITLVNHLYYEANKVIFLQLEAQTQGIGSGSAPTLTIDQNTIRSYIFAQGLEIEAPWDGIISIQESVAYVTTQMALYGITDGISISIENPMQTGLSTILKSISSNLQSYSISDIVTLDLEYGDQILRMGQGHRAGAGRMFAPITI